MTNIEHLVENGILELKRGVASQDFLTAPYNKMMLEEVSATREELLEICVYIVYSYDIEQRMDIINEIEAKYGYPIPEN